MQTCGLNCILISVRVMKNIKQCGDKYIFHYDLHDCKFFDNLCAKYSTKPCICMCYKIKIFSFLVLKYIFIVHSITSFGHEWT